MKKYTIEEKQILLDAIGHYIDAGEHAKNILVGKNKDKFIQELLKVRDLRAKLILSIGRIKTIKLPNTNADLSFCCLCSTRFYLNYPKQAIIKDFGDVCDVCLEKYN